MRPPGVRREKGVRKGKGYPPSWQKEEEPTANPGRKKRFDLFEKRRDDKEEGIPLLEEGVARH